MYALGVLPVFALEVSNRYFIPFTSDELLLMALDIADVVPWPLAATPGVPEKAEIKEDSKFDRLGVVAFTGFSSYFVHSIQSYLSVKQLQFQIILANSALSLILMPSIFDT